MLEISSINPIRIPHLENYHLIPANDLRLHSMDFECWCSPDIQGLVAPFVIVHISADGRERFDIGNPRNRVPRC